MTKVPSNRPTPAADPRVASAMGNLPDHKPDGWFKNWSRQKKIYDAGVGGQTGIADALIPLDSTGAQMIATDGVLRVTGDAMRQTTGAEQIGVLANCARQLGRIISRAESLSQRNDSDRESVLQNVQQDIATTQGAKHDLVAAAAIGQAQDAKNNNAALARSHDAVQASEAGVRAAQGDLANATCQSQSAARQQAAQIDVESRMSQGTSSQARHRSALEEQTVAIAGELLHVVLSDVATVTFDWSTTKVPTRAVLLHGETFLCHIRRAHGSDYSKLVGALKQSPGLMLEGWLKRCWSVLGAGATIEAAITSERHIKNLTHDGGVRNRFLAFQTAQQPCLVQLVTKLFAPEVAFADAMQQLLSMSEWATLRDALACQLAQTLPPVSEEP